MSEIDSGDNQLENHQNAFNANPNPDEAALVLKQIASIETFRSSLEPRPSLEVAGDLLVVLRYSDISNPTAKKQPSWGCVTGHGRDIYVHKEKATAGLADASGAIVSKKYSLHGSFNPTTEDRQLYASVVEPIVDFAKAGGNGCVICYGQTGSGKTWTATHMQKYAAESLFSGSSTVTLSFFELRGPSVSDLLNDRAALPVRTDEDGTVIAVGLSEHPVSSVEALQALLHDAGLKRSTAATSSNAQSSRSHAFCVLNFENGGKLRFVDLAGSETRADALDHDAERVEEMAQINLSLSDLKECIRLNLDNAKSAKKQHVPYRRSKLTMLLKDALDSEANHGRTAFLAHVSRDRANLSQTVNTLTYAEFMIAASRATQEKEKFVGPDAWTTKQVSKWVKELDGGRFVHPEHGPLGDYFMITGKIFATMWKGDVDKRILAAGWTQVDADFVYEAFHDLVKEAKKKNAKPRTIALPKKEGAGKDMGVLLYGDGLSAACVENSNNKEDSAYL